MSKMEWSRPEAVVEKFVANEYVAACGDSGTVYKFKCNAGTYGHRYTVWTERNNYLAGGWGSRFEYYSPCNETHEASSDDEFIKGYMDDQSTPSNEKIPVIIWTDRGTDVHCTTNLDKNTWETAKS